MKPTRSKRNLSLDLWNQVWTEVGDEIAKSMDTIDWWKASGACKGMFKVQPRHIKMVPQSTHVLCWLVMHWSQVKVLDLDLSMLPLGNPAYDQWDDSEAASWEARDLKDQVTGLSSLQALRLHATDLYSISTLTQLPLRHLQLEVTDSLIISGLNKLGAMAQLETLMIKCNDESEFFDVYPNGGGIFAEIDLRACTKLHAVAFSIFVPKGLEVPKGCSVHLLGACKVLTDISSLRVCTTCTCVENSPERLSHFLGATFTALTDLRIDATWTPDDDDRDEDGNDPPINVILGENVKHLRALSIQTGSRGINLSITGSLQLTSLEVLDEGELNVSISNVASLAASLQVYRMEWNGSSFHTHAQLFELLCAITCLDKGDPHMGSRSGPDSDSDNGNDSDSDNGNANVLNKLCWMQGTTPIDVKAVKAQLAACTCCACWECLKRAGVFDTLLK